MSEQHHLKGSICLSDIPKEYVFEFNGKKYISIGIRERQTPSAYGDTHYIRVNKPKDVAEPIDKSRTFIGKAKPDIYEPNNGQQPQTMPQQTGTAAPAPLPADLQAADDDLPF